MTPRDYESLIAQSYQQQGYIVDQTRYACDYGVDLFAQKGIEKLAVQVKMFGNTARKINRQMVMELHGAKDYFDCTKAIIATDGQVIDNAKEVAKKIKN